jgi:hypothetical protein
MLYPASSLLPKLASGAGILARKTSLTGRDLAETQQLVDT